MHLQSCVSEQNLLSFSCLVPFGRHDECYFYFIRLFILFRVTFRQVVFGLPERFFLSTGLQEDLSAFFTSFSGSTVNFDPKLLRAQNLICLHSLSYTPYTTYYILKNSSFRLAWTQKQNKSRCILGAFIVPLNKNKNFNLECE